MPDGLARVDIGVTGGKIAAIGNLSGAEAETILDANGLSVLPGAIDTQVHFREPGMEHKEDLESGTRAAIFGGVTTVLEMPNTIPPTTTPQALEDKIWRAKGRAWCNHGFFIGASLENLDQLRDLEMLSGTPGIKIFMASSTGPLLLPDDDSIRKVLQNGQRRCAVHAEDQNCLNERKAALKTEPTPADHPKLRDAECARRATERLLRLSEETHRPVHILHVSTEEELPLIANAKKHNLGTTAEVTPQHLWFHAPEAYATLSTLAQMNPPIRERRHQEALRKALSAGQFDVIGSDHAPHTLEEKALPYPQSPSGMPGVQTLLPVMLTLALRENLIDLQTLVKMTSANPAKIYGIRSKGAIREGFDADLAIVDLKNERVVENSWIQSKCGWSPFAGAKLIGYPVHVIVGGNVALRDGDLQGEPMGQPCEYDWKGVPTHGV